jgi:hypothetical protein
MCTSVFDYAEGGSTREPWQAIDAPGRWTDRQVKKTLRSKLDRKIIRIIEEGLEIKLNRVLGKHPGSRRKQDRSKRKRYTQRELKRRAFAIKHATRFAQDFLRTMVEDPKYVSRN